MTPNLKNRYMVFATVSVLFILSATYYMRQYPITSTIREHFTTPASAAKPESKPTQEPTHQEEPEKPHPKYKPEPSIKSIPVVDNFPLAAAAHSAADLPPIPSWNKPPEKHVEEITPLLIGFTRNWALLQQVVVSYVTAGWPVEDIYVVENTGVMDSNAKGKLSLQNPFSLNHTRLDLFGVNIIRTPALLTFAQLQNFYLHTAIEKEWPAYFWSHMDVTALTNETIFNIAHPDLTSPTADHTEYRSLYQNAVLELRAIKNLTPPASNWSLRFFSYDHLTLVRTQALIEVGGWDTMIPYYKTDCDMHQRLSWAELKIEVAYAGDIYDIASSLDDLLVLYRKKNTGVKASFTDPTPMINKVAEEEDRKKEAEKEKEEERKKKQAEKEKAAAQPNKRDTNLPSNSSDINIITQKSVEPTPGRVWEEDDIGGPLYEELIKTLRAMLASKADSKRGRNTWQTAQLGGKGEPFYRDPLGFDKALGMTIDIGQAVYREKWGHRDCELGKAGLSAADAWRVEHDWE